MERVWDSRVTPNIYIKVPQTGKFCLYVCIWLMLFDTNVSVHMHSAGSSHHLALTVELPFSSVLGKWLRQITYLIQNLLKNYKSLKREPLKLVFSLLATHLGCFALIILSKLDACLVSKRLTAKSCGWPKLSRTFSLPIWKLLPSPWAAAEPLLVQAVKPKPLFFSIASLRWAQTPPFAPPGQWPCALGLAEKPQPYQVGLAHRGEVPCESRDARETLKIYF